MCKKSEEELSPVQEILKLKFDDKKANELEVHDFLMDLYDELGELFENDEEPQTKGEDGEIHIIRRQDDEPNNVIPFAVLKKASTFLEYKCPHCNFESKVSIQVFQNAQFRPYTCPECHKDFLLKLNLDPSIKIYLEQ